MKVLLTSVVWIALAPVLFAQGDSPSSFEPTRGQGYGYFAVSNAESNFGRALSVGAGGDGFVWRGLAAGGDAGYIFTTSGYVSGIGLASANMSYHFREVDPNGRWVPFVTGGYTLGFRGGTAGLMNYGGGLTYWVRPRWGVRAEFRQYQNADFSMPSFRFGVSFR